VKDRLDRPLCRHGVRYRQENREENPSSDTSSAPSRVMHRVPPESRRSLAMGTRSKLIRGTDLPHREASARRRFDPGHGRIRSESCGSVGSSSTHENVLHWTSGRHLPVAWRYAYHRCNVEAMHSPSGPHRHSDFTNRRLRPERRIGDRRCRIVPVDLDRRAGPERRRSADRREGAPGHIRNALQVLSALSSGDLAPADRERAVEAAINRLWLALLEVERLIQGRRAMGARMRRYESDISGDDHASST